MATICTQIMMSFVSDYLAVTTRPMFFMKVRALLMQNFLIKAFR
jgi:hypothetical protein